MNYSHEEIIKALVLIKDICTCHRTCDTCPFRTESRDCTFQLRSHPDTWILADDTNDWRAFDELI